MKNLLQRHLLYSYACLLLGMALLVLTGSKWHIGLAAWIYPVLLLRYLGTRKGTWNLLLFFALDYMAIKLAYAGAVPVPGFMGLLVLLLITSFAAFPFFLHYFIYRPQVFWATLVLPVSLVAAEFMFSFGPYGTWGSIANSQYDDKILLQVASLTGQCGITFVIGWTASVVNWLWSHSFQKQFFFKLKGYFAFMALVAIFGLVRWLAPPASDQKVKIAGIAVKMNWGHFDMDELAKETLNSKYENQRLHLVQLSDQWLGLAEKEAKAGANIVVGAEVNVLILKQDEPSFLEKAMKLAKKDKVYLFVGLGVPIPGKIPFSLENKVIIISPEGSVLSSYYKSNPVPGETCIKGNGVLPVINSPYGRLSTVICYDADFPDLVKQAGQNKINLLIIPANDWQEISPFHTKMAFFRGIENGTSVIRETTRGLAAITDASGNIVASKDYFDGGELVMVADIPVHGKWAFYPIIGNAFAWLCCIVIGAWSILSVCRFFIAKMKRPSYA
jgi:apolipoprotein N-acyltransferase